MADTIIVWIVQKEKGLLRAIFKSGYEKSILFGYQKGEDVIGSKNDREENKIIM